MSAWVRQLRQHALRTVKYSPPRQLKWVRGQLAPTYARECARRRRQIANGQLRVSQ